MRKQFDGDSLDVVIDVKTKSIHEDKFVRTSVVSFVIWCNSNWDATLSTEFPSKVLVSGLYKCLSFALRIPIATSRYGLFSNNFSKVNSKLCEYDKKYLEKIHK